MTEAPAYRVLARKYRPSVLAELVGQDALVRTLTNAFGSGRIAHAFLLTGVRGIGKTTTARIIAKALNCIGPDGSGGPTIAPCGVCEHCRAIAEDRHVDVVEMDAASRTGVDDIRAITDAVRYAPAAARNKVYIIDEVHMLSKAAFNALLKTLEEPPPHVVFVFATTEVRRLPLTVLSRCQRFDLRRLEPDTMAAHLERIAAKEGVTAEPAALALLARAAEGSVRDGLSLLDQAMALGGDSVSEAVVKEMLGLADRGRVFDLFEALLAGEIAGALAALRELYALGADPVTVLQDLLDLVHWLTRQKAVPGATDPGARTLAEQERGADLAARVSMGVLARAWQMLLKGLEECQIAPDPMTAVEMVLVRLAYVADLPGPAELVDRIAGAAPAKAPPPAASGPPPAPQAGRSSSGTRAQGGAVPARRAEPDEYEDPGPQTQARTEPVANFADVVRIAAERREPRLHADLQESVHLVRFEDGRIEFRPGAHAPADLASRLRARLAEWTGRPWAIVISAEPGSATLREQKDAEAAAAVAEVQKDETVQAILAAFPGARIAEVRDVPVPPVPAPPPADGDVPVDEEPLEETP